MAYNCSTSQNGLRQTLSWLHRYREDHALSSAPVAISNISGNGVGCHDIQSRLVNTAVVRDTLTNQIAPRLGSGIPILTI